MIRILMEDNPQDHCWKVTCDKCGFQQSFQTSQEIVGWNYKKIFFDPVEKHYCPSCQ